MNESTRNKRCKCIGHWVQIVDLMWIVDFPDPDCEAHHDAEGQLEGWID